MTNILITGSNSGFGRLAALSLAREGHRGIATMRTVSKGDDLRRLAGEEGLAVEIRQLDVDKRNIEERIEVASALDGSAAFFSVFGFTVLMVTREGMETALLMNALIFQVANSGLLIVGAAAGTLLAAFVAWLWSQHGHRVNLARFFQVTGVFLAIFVVQLIIYGFHELTEAHIFPYSETLHWATEPYGPDGIYGRYLTYLLVALPLSWLLYANIVDRRRRPAAIRDEPSDR